jgi:hypothetical protein
MLALPRLSLWQRHSAVKKKWLVDAEVSCGCRQLKVAQ